ncbi:hypothetical protein F2P81_004024 [Scophthalmus maximus]|uniref:Uncharacterized protein n=1 Tax=Scophthalmus maximus TaxID=52904 RepID=A0A6A4T8L5_SCOMX|nr:hypothetical protein F2P81_004024 [Scophthalmus maximus]
MSSIRRKTLQPTSDPLLRPKTKQKTCVSSLSETPRGSSGQNRNMSVDYQLSYHHYRERSYNDPPMTR